MNIVLIGYRGVGKTTVGRLLAKKMKRPFVDTDSEVERIAKMNVQKIVSDFGWKAFRKKESEVARVLLKNKNTVMSTGGGTFTENMIRIDKRKNIVVLLTADIQKISSRIRGTKRPSITGKGASDEIADVLKKRERKYVARADVVIDTSQVSQAKVASMIIEYVGRMKL